VRTDGRGARPARRHRRRHLVPNIAPLTVAQATIRFGYAMVDPAAISFRGPGATTRSQLGVMISENQSGILQGYPPAREAMT
jgi:peptide/nickel transport system permease protein